MFKTSLVAALTLAVVTATPFGARATEGVYMLFHEPFCWKADSANSIVDAWKAKNFDAAVNAYRADAACLATVQPIITRMVRVLRTERLIDSDKHILIVSVYELASSVDEKANHIYTVHVEDTGLKETSA